MLIALVINVGEGPTIEEVEGPTLAFMQGIVGGYIETAFRLDSPEKGRSIDAYCNEEGLLEGLPFNLLTPYGTPIVGNIVIVAGNEKTGESEGLTASEVSFVLEKLGLSLD